MQVEFIPSRTDRNAIKIHERNGLSFKVQAKDRKAKKSPYLESFWSVFFTHFPAFGLNTEIYAISLRVQSKCGKMREKCGLE